MIEEEENSHLDDSLRRVFEDFELPADDLWAGIEQRLPDAPEPPRRRRRPLPLPLLLPLALLLGLVGGWLLPHPGAAPTAQVRVVESRSATAARPATPRADMRSATSVAAASASAAQLPAQPAIASSAANQLLAQPATTAQAATRRITTAGPAPATPTGALAATPPAAAGPGRHLVVQPALPGGLTVVVDSVRPAAEATSTIIVRASADTVPGLVRPLVVLTRANLAYLRDSAAEARPVSRRVALVNSLRAEKSELLRLQRRVDSLLLALGAVPLANPTAPLAAQPAPPAPDTARSRPLRRWSLLLTATPERNYQQLRTPDADTLLAMRRNQERGRRGLNAALMAEYRLNNRLSIGAGLGYSRSSTELRVAEQRTDVSVRYDTTTTTAVNVFTSTHTTYSIRLEQIPQLNPIFNQGGQVIGYDTVFITRPDTVYTTIVQNDTVRTTNKTVTPLLDKRTSTVYRNLTPTYHFFTVPVLLRYRLTLAENTRWWADVALGGQVQLFLGGSQLVTEDGRNYRTERVRPTEGPFRPLNLALSGSFGVNYALTPRLSMSLAPSLRWQALSVYKPSTGLVQRSTATGLQIGARWQF